MIYACDELDQLIADIKQPGGSIKVVRLLFDNILHLFYDDNMDYFSDGFYAYDVRKTVLSGCECKFEYVGPTPMLSASTKNIYDENANILFVGPAEPALIQFFNPCDYGPPPLSSEWYPIGGFPHAMPSVTSNPDGIMCDGEWTTLFLPEVVVFDPLPP